MQINHSLSGAQYRARERSRGYRERGCARAIGAGPLYREGFRSRRSDRYGVERGRTWEIELVRSSWPHAAVVPDGGGGYRVENLPLDWDAEFGQELKTAQAELHGWKFPFSGGEWNSFSVGVSGSLRFGPAQGGRVGSGPAGSGGIAIGRFDELQQVARALVNTVPAICVFFKPRISGSRFMKGASGPGGGDVERQRACWRHSGLHLAAYGKPLSSRAAARWHGPR